MKITKAQLKQLIKEEIEEMRRRDPGFELENPRTGERFHLDARETSPEILRLLGVKPKGEPSLRKTLAIRIGSLPTLVEPKEEEEPPERVATGSERIATLGKLFTKGTDK